MYWIPIRSVKCAGKRVGVALKFAALYIRCLRTPAVSGHSPNIKTTFLLSPDFLLVHKAKHTFNGASWKRSLPCRWIAAYIDAQTSAWRQYKKPVITDTHTRPVTWKRRPRLDGLLVLFFEIRLPLTFVRVETWCGTIEKLIHMFPVRLHCRRSVSIAIPFDATFAPNKWCAAFNNTVQLFGHNTVAKEMPETENA